jgi:Fibronectin type III domain
MSGSTIAVFQNQRSFRSLPVNKVAPAVTGTATVGQTLSTTDGTWTGLPTPTFTYQWQRTGSNISGATSSIYVLVAADYNNTISCVVTATNEVSSVSANSNSTASVVGNAPVNTVTPAVTGTATVGQTLSTTNGTWTGVPTPTFTYQWQRAGSNISGATSSTYTLVAADASNTIRCIVTAINTVSAVDATSNSTASVAAVVPDAPTGVSATAASSSAIFVSFSAPASNGGASIDYYQVVCTGSGTNSATGTSPISITGLNPLTAYTFKVRAHNSIGYGSYSGTANATTQAVTGCASYTSAGGYTWYAPSGVTSISIIAIGAGASGSGWTRSDPYNAAGGSGGGAGALVYINNYSVTPSTGYSIYIGSSGTGVGGGGGGNYNGYNSYPPCVSAQRGRTGGPAYFYDYAPSSYAVYAGGGTGGYGYAGAGTGYPACNPPDAPGGSPLGASGFVGFSGGYGAHAIGYVGATGGGGAAGYSGNGGNGSSASTCYYTIAPAACSGAASGGGSGIPINGGGGGGGGVGIYGKGSTGTSTHNSYYAAGGSAGSGGTAGVSAPYGCSTGAGTSGGNYGGGGGGLGGYGKPTGYYSGAGGSGAVRIVWPGNTRSFPSTNVS